MNFISNLWKMCTCLYNNQRKLISTNGFYLKRINRIKIIKIIKRKDFPRVPGAVAGWLAGWLAAWQLGWLAGCPSRQRFRESFLFILCILFILFKIKSIEQSRSSSFFQTHSQVFLEIQYNSYIS